MTLNDQVRRAARAVEQAEEDLRETGIAIIPDMLVGDRLRAARDALVHAARADRESGWTIESILSDHGTQRVWNLPSRDALFCQLVEHPVALQLVRAMIGWPALLSNFSANITQPGSGEMVLHADQSLSPLPWASVHGLNILWCLDDFTDEVGATRMVPGSHRLNRMPEGAEYQSETVAVEAPAGSLIAMEGRVWHKTGRNRTADRQRAGLFAYYTLPHILPQENWWLSLDARVRQYGSDTLLQLLGFAGRNPMGRVNGMTLDALRARGSNA